MTLDLNVHPYNVDRDAWDARMENKREEQHRHWALAHAAKYPKRVTQPKPEPRTATCECGETFTATTHNKRYCSTVCQKRAGRDTRRVQRLRPCTSCGRTTRPAGTSVDDHPDTISRYQNNMCHACWRATKPAATPAVVPCTVCGRLTRPRGTSVDDHPGTIIRQSGKCKTCAGHRPAPPTSGRTCNSCGASLDGEYAKRLFCSKACTRRHSKQRREGNT